MKIGSELQCECPDVCPGNCRYISDFSTYGQNSICGRCPVFVCAGPVDAEDDDFMPLVRASEYRDDWAAEWHDFFKYGKEPILNFNRSI